MNLADEQILVTGADGFIGSHLTEELLRRGCRVRAFVYYNSLNSWGWLDSLAAEPPANLDVVAGDVRDAASVEQAMDGCGVVLHLAALIAIPYSYRCPSSYVETNIRGTMNVLDSGRKLGVKKIVHTSTSEVYGSAQSVPINESHPLNAQSPYAATKIAGDQLALSYAQSFDLPVAVIRPFNTYGPRQSARAVIPTVITQIAAGQEVIRLGATEPTRDFNYVADTVAGFIAVAESDQTIGRVLNTGTGHEISIADTAALIARVMDRQVMIEQDPDRLRPSGSEVDRLCADASLAKQLTGWEPAYAGVEGLERGLAQTAAWFGNAQNLARYRVGQYQV